MIIRLFIITILSMIYLAGISQKKAYNLKFKVKGPKDTIAHLANYYGDKLYYTDTATVNSKGEFVFDGTEPLKGGMYAVVVPGPKWFELVINEPEFFMETDTANFAETMKIKGSKENEIFFGYLKFINAKRKNAKTLKGELDKLENQESSEAEKLKEQLKTIDKSVKDYQNTLIEKNPDLLVTKILKISIDPKIPDAPKDKDGNITDSLFAYKYFKKHYFDNIDLKDDRLVRAPVFHSKLSGFFEKMVPQIPDSIINDADWLISKTDEGSEMFKYIVHFLTYKYESSKIMGMDAVFVHLGKKYYKSGKAFWMDEEKLEKLTERVDKLEPLLLHKKAPNLTLADTTEKNWISLYGLKADYTILYIWDPKCGHCKKELPKLRELYKKMDHDKIKVYAVGSPLETKEWIKYVKENEMDDFINVSDFPDANKNPQKYIPQFTDLQSLNFRITYDVFSTPQVYILDKDKKIIAKKIDTDQIEEVIEQYDKLKKEEKSN